MHSEIIETCLKSGEDRGTVVERLQEGFCEICRPVEVFGYLADVEQERWPRSVEKLVESARSGCIYCAILCSGIDVLGHHTRHIDISLRQFQLHIVEREVSGDLPELRMTVVGGGYLRDSINVFVIGKANIDCHLPRDGDVCEDTGSDAAIAQISTWTKTCIDEHDCDAQHKEIQDSPTRLIEVVPNPAKVGGYGLRLVEPKGDSYIQYICLSHHWPLDQAILQSNRANMSDHYKDIPWLKLSLTFQHAISVTFRLGIQYIWIDSLCICQDSIDDWRHEGSKMGSIYQGAYLTIAASTAGNGLFVQRPDLKSQSLFCYRDQGGSLDIHARVWFRQRGSLQTSDNRIALPLVSRGWVLQEQFLSRRIVHFGPEELIWECDKMATCECKQIRSWQSLSGTVNATAAFSPPREIWHDIVSDYTKRNLTYAKDIFPALQGIAKHHKKTRPVGVRYYAGLWSDTIFQDLLWFTRHRQELARPSDWRAPSWSWASVSGAEFPKGYLRGLRHEDVQIIKIQTIPTGTDVFGELVGGSLRIRGRSCFMRFGPMTFVHGSFIKDEVYGNFEDQFDLYPDWGARQNGYLPLCNPVLNSEQHTAWTIREFETSEVLVLQICKTEQANWTISLVLRCVDKERQIYERVGLLWHRSEPEGWEELEGWEIREVEII